MTKHSSSPQRKARTARKGFETASFRGTAPALRGGASLLVFALGLPLVMGARGCEKVVVGHECDGKPCADGGSSGSAGGGAGSAGGAAGSAGGAAGSAGGAAGSAGGTAGSAGGGAGSGGAGCTYAGKRHKVGDNFPSQDGCNTCQCDPSGAVACTERACTNVCGGLTGLQCPSGEYCNFPPDAQCGAADQTGTCATVPQACDLQYDPVCGCDDHTYGNDCEAAASSVSVAHTGECDGAGGGQDCGGLTGLPCPSGEYCNFPPDALCGAADQTGTCAMITQACTLQYDPVCGCDDKTYGNACAAAGASVSVAHTGECAPDGGGGSGQTCGGIAALQCPAKEFCNYEESAGGQGCDGSISDAGGVCETQPQICTTQYDPVCGCNRRTYGNACEAHAAGEAALDDGACTEIDCAAIGGHPVDGIGPAPMCPKGEVDHGSIVYSNGNIAIEGTACCVP